MAEDGGKPPVDKGFRQRLYESSKRHTRLLPLAVSLFGLWMVGRSGELANDCPNVHNALSFGIRPARIAQLTQGCTLTKNQLKNAMLIDSLGALIYGLGLAALLLAFWRFGWRSRRQGSFETAKKIALLPFAAGAFDVLENFTVISYADVRSGAVHIGWYPAQFVATFGLAKWILAAATVFAIFLTLYGAFRFRALKMVTWEEVDEVNVNRMATLRTPPEGLAVCLSGGGIRSASFSWGALAQLQRNGMFHGVTSMYTVSGGGYAANAWTSSDPALRKKFSEGFYAFDEARDSIAKRGDTELPTTPFQHVQQNHRYLDSLRGGLGFALTKALISIVVNVSVIVSGVVIVAILPGLLARSVFGAVTNNVVDKTLVSTGEGVRAVRVITGGLRSGAWMPALWMLAFAGAAFVVSWILGRVARRGVLVVMGALLGLAAAIAIVTIVLPWLAHNLYGIFDKAWWSTVVPAGVTWAAGLVLAYLRPRLSKIAIRLGGVLSAIGMFYVFVWVIRRLVVQSERLWSWIPDAESAKLHWLVVLGIAAVFLILLDHTGVQWWSLHPLYRDRLAGAFVMRQNNERKMERLPSNEWRRWSELATESKKPANKGPKHVICAATHRRQPSVTGLKSLSYRFSTDGVAFYEPVLNNKGTIDVNRYRKDAAWLDSALGIKSASKGSPRFRVRKTFRSHARSTSVAAAAMSGAAFNSVMGRQSKGTTDSLLAVLNLRLGVWMPNNRFDTSPGFWWIHKNEYRKTHVSDKKRSFPRPGLRYLFHEVIGHFDIEDPFVHVSDGGHWENLGLTEAVRDRAQRIIVVDASGGRIAPYTEGAAGEGFASLQEAIDLSRIELAAEIVLNVRAMRPDPQTGRAAQNWTEGFITYHYDREHNWQECEGKDTCPKAALIYVKAVICDRTPEGVLAYANTDRTFPDYPTGDQFLTDEQFDALVRLGSSAVKDAFVFSGRDSRSNS